MKKIELPINEVIEKYNLGLSCEQIARDYNVSSVTIKNQLIQAGAYKNNRNLIDSVLKGIRQVQDKLSNIEKLDNFDKERIQDAINEMIETYYSIE